MTASTIAYRGLKALVPGGLRKRLRNAIQDRYRLHFREICRREFAYQPLQRNERPIEYRFLFESLSKTSPFSVLDVGTGTTALPHVLRTCGFIVTAIDNVVDYWPAGMFNRHYHVIDDDIRDTRLTDTFDLIACISTLEHIENHQDAVRSMFSLLNPGGHIVLTFPYNETHYVANVYDLPDAGFGKHVQYICQAYSRRELNGWLEANGGTIVDQEYWQCWTGHYWTVGDKLHQPLMVENDQLHQLSCVLIKKEESQT